MKSKYYIFGAGGFAREVAAYLSCDHYIHDTGFVVDDEYWKEGLIRLSEFDKNQPIFIAIGDPLKRKEIAETKGLIAHSFIHPQTTIHSPIRIGGIVCPGVVVTCNVELGMYAQLNLMTTIGHDCKIGDYFTTGPGANISGRCIIGDCVYVGSNAAIKQGITICDNVTIGMGAVVVMDIPEPGTYVGNPAKRLTR